MNSRPGGGGLPKRGDSGYIQEDPLYTARVAQFQAARLDDIALAEVRALWWRQVRLGNRMVAERGVIVISNADDAWPRPRTGAPQAEAGGAGGGR